MGRGPEKIFSKEDIQMANGHMERCFTLLIIRKMQIKVTRKFQPALDRMALIESLQTINV